MSSGEAITRRQALAVAARAAATAALPDDALAQAAKTCRAGGRTILTPRELAILDGWPSPSSRPTRNRAARARQNARNISTPASRRASIPTWRQSWKDDLAEIDEVSIAMLGRPLLQASPAERQKLMERISRNEKNPREERRALLRHHQVVGCRSLLHL